MTNRKHQNSILVLVLFLVGSVQFTVAQSPKADNNVINTAPFLDLATTVKTSLESEDIDLDNRFVVEYTGTLGKNGKLDLKTGKFTRVEGDERSAEIAKQSILAISDSGYLQYLKDLSAGNFIIALEQDASDFSATFNSKLDSENRARSAASAVSLLLSLAKMEKQKPEATESDKDLLAILNSILATADARDLTIRIVLPKAVFHEMLIRRLAAVKLESVKP